MSYSHMGTPTLPSAMLHFTAEFEMGSGGAIALLSPENWLLKSKVQNTLLKTNIWEYESSIEWFDQGVFIVLYQNRYLIEINHFINLSRNIQNFLGVI